jgi:hypothetical protein
VTRLFFEIHVGKGLPVQIFHHKTGVQFLDGPGLRKVALMHGLLKHARHPPAPRNRRQAAPPAAAPCFIVRDANGQALASLPTPNKIAASGNRGAAF